MNRTSRLIRSGLAAGLLAIALAIPPTTSAAPIAREQYSGSDSFSFDDCGFVVNGEVTFSGLFMLKSGRAGDATPYYFDNYQSREVLTNPETGAWMEILHNGLYRDLQINLVEGTVYEFVAIETGRPFTVVDSDGTVVVRDRGQLTTRFLVDTQGDDDLSNDVFIDGSWELLKDAGSHPGFYLDICPVITDLIG